MDHINESKYIFLVSVFVANAKYCRLKIFALENIVKPDLIATEMLAFPSKSSRNKNDSYLTIAIL